MLYEVITDYLGEYMAGGTILVLGIGGGVPVGRSLGAFGIELHEVGEDRVCEQRHVAEQVMEDVRLDDISYNFV